MRPTAIRALILAGALLAAAAAHSADSPATSTGAPQPKPGDRGTVRTALQGNRIEEIPLEFLGTYKDFAGPGYDLHLVKLEGPVAEHVGVAAGMSGSPVYFDGRLIGSLSYRLGGLPRDAVGGVTPIEDILDASRLSVASGSGAGRMASPIATPIVAGGLTGVARDWLSTELEPMGFILAGGGASSSGGSGNDPLAPGSPVGVALVRGDLTLASTGTVTRVDEERVYAFGHPFLGSGRAELPMVSAQVIHTLADLAGSVKLANVGSEIGAVVEDRLSAVVGDTTQRARMIPVTLAVDGGAYGTQSFEFELAKSTVLTPLLAGVVVANTMLANSGYDRKATVMVSGRVAIRGAPDLTIEAAFAGDGPPDPALAVAGVIQQTLVGLWGNSLADVDVESMQFDVRVNPELLRYSVESLRYDRGPLRPGQTLDVTCVLRRYRGESESRRLTIEIPRDLPPRTTLALAVGPPSQIDRALGQPIAKRVRSAEDVASVVRSLNEIRSSHRLTAVLFERAEGVITRGVSYEDLPLSAGRLLAANAASTSAARTRVARLAATEVELDGPVEGGLVVRLRVDGGLSSDDGDAPVPAPLTKESRR